MTHHNVHIRVESLRRVRSLPDICNRSVRTAVDKTTVILDPQSVRLITAQITGSALGASTVAGGQQCKGMESNGRGAGVGEGVGEGAGEGAGGQDKVG